MTSSFPEIIILAGGFGTRLQSVVKDVPKPMAPIAGKPFLHWLLQYISKCQLTEIIILERKESLLYADSAMELQSF